jgi:hypothetical protein
MALAEKPAVEKAVAPMGVVAKATAAEVNQEMKGFKSLASSPTATPKFPGLPGKRSLGKAAGTGVPAAPKAPSAPAPSPTAAPKPTNGPAKPKAAPPSAKPPAA